ncbi:MAG: nuclear transport factor 2 family protein [Pseudomonadota bacterium]
MIQAMMQQLLKAIATDLAPGQASAAVHAYLASWKSGDSAARAALFTDNAVLEDPVGAPPIEGKAALQAFWQRAEGPHSKFEPALQRLVVCGNEAMVEFMMRIDVTGAGSATLRIVENFQFDASGKIRRLRAFWDEQSVS